MTHWENYYVIVGSSAAALTGLQFVVIALVAESSLRAPTSIRTVAAFGTPTVVHFCAALLISAIISAPWNSLTSVAWAITVVGIGGLFYDVIVIRRANKQEEYEPVLEDWIWHTVLPIISHTTILVAGLSLRHGPAGPLFAVGTATLLLLFIGIPNALVTVTYVALGRPALQAGPDRESTPPPR